MKEFVNQPFNIKFIVQFERHNIKKFKLTNLIDDPVYKTYKKYFIGIDFTG